MTDEEIVKLLERLITVLRGVSTSSADLTSREAILAEKEARVAALEQDLVTRIQRSRELWG